MKMDIKIGKEVILPEDKFVLTTENYHSHEANQHSMTNSQFKQFLECESKAMAAFRGEYHRPRTKAFLIGSYVDAWVGGELEAFKRDPANSEIFTQKGELKADFKLANEMIASLETDTNAMITLQGESQVIFTAEFAGMQWRVMMDKYNRERRTYIEFKTAADFGKEWNKETRKWASFVNHYDYPRQIAICLEIERLALGEETYGEALILAVTKQSPPNKILLDMTDDARRAKELDLIRMYSPRIKRLREGQEEPTECGECDWCRLNKKITGAINFNDLDLEL